jgi:hypothetical protein
MDSINKTYEREVILFGVLNDIDYDTEHNHYYITLDGTKIDSNEEFNLALSSEYGKHVLLVCKKEYKKGKPTLSLKRKLITILKPKSIENREVVHTLCDFDEEYNAIPIEQKYTTDVMVFELPIGKAIIPVEVYKFSDNYFHTKYKGFGSIDKSQSGALQALYDDMYIAYFCVNSPTITEEQLGEVGKLEKELLNNLLGLELCNSINKLNYE